MSRVMIGVGPCHCAEKERLARLVEAFAEAMLEKLEAKTEDGWTGWDNVDGDFDEAVILERIQGHTDGDKWDPIDVANFAAFAWHQRKEAGR